MNDTEYALGHDLIFYRGTKSQLDHILNQLSKSADMRTSSSAADDSEEEEEEGSDGDDDLDIEDEVDRGDPVSAEPGEVVGLDFLRANYSAREEILEQERASVQPMRLSFDRFVCRSCLAINRYMNVSFYANRVGTSELLILFRPGTKMKQVRRSIPPPISFEADFGPNSRVAQELPLAAQEVPQKAQEIPQRAEELPQMSPEVPWRVQDVPKESPGNVPGGISSATTLESDTGRGKKKSSRNNKSGRNRRRRRSTPNCALSSLNRSESVDLTSSQVFLEDHQRSLSGLETGRVHRGRGGVQVAFKSMPDWMTDGVSRPKVNNCQ